MKLNNIITIDGPSASGKGSLSRNLAKYLDFNILDSGRGYCKRIQHSNKECRLKSNQMWIN